MTKRIKKNSNRFASAAGIFLVLGVLIYALVAYAAAPITRTYSSGTYSTEKSKFGRGVDTVYAKMVNGLSSKTYYAEYFGPTSDGGSDLVSKYGGRNGPFTSFTTLDVVHSQATNVSDFSGTNWQVRFYHNPYPAADSPAYVVIDSPTPSQVINTGQNFDITFHLVDRDGNTITGNHFSDLRARVTNGTTNVYRLANLKAPKSNGSGWTYDAGTYQYVFWTNTGTRGYSSATAGTLMVRVLGNTAWAMSAAETDPAGGSDGFAMGALENVGYFELGTVTSSAPWNIVPAAGMNESFFSTPDSASHSYSYYFDLLDKDGNIMPDFAGTWTLKTATSAADYDGSGQLNIPGTVYRPNYSINTTSHWLCVFNFPTPGKYQIKLTANLTNIPAITQVVNFGASHRYELSGDVAPPGPVTGVSATPSDNSVSLGWTNPTDPDYIGTLILRNTASITDAPASGQHYSLDGSDGPNTINTSKVVYVNTGTSLVDGDPCVPASRLVNDNPDTVYYYKFFTFDDKYNYNVTGAVQTSGNPADTVNPGAVTGVGVTEGNQKNTVTWTNPADCDINKIEVWSRTDGTFPAVRGEAGSTKAGEKIGATPGAPDSFLDQGLTNGLPYYYTVWVQDDDGRWSAAASPATYAVPHDVTAPAAVSDLHIVPGSTMAFDITVAWTSPGDDGGTGTATRYDLRFYNQPIDDGNWNQAWHSVGASLPQPLPAGSGQSYMVSGLAPLERYYFAIKAVDEANNQSPVSTGTPNDKTLCNPELTGCNQCHLMPPDDDLPGAHPRGSGNIGAHYLPIHAGGGTTPEQCNVCHYNGQVWRNNTTLISYNHQNDSLDLNGPGQIGNEYERTNHTGGTLTLWTTTMYKYKNYSSGIGYRVLTGYCTNTYCHGAGLSSPRWGLDGIVCGEYCHETPPATGKHVKHYHPGQYYINFGPTPTNGDRVSGYTNDNGSGWTPAASYTTRGLDPATGGNRDRRYSTFISSSNSEKTISLPNGTYYITVCVGDPMGAVNPPDIAQDQFVQVSGNGGASWINLIDNFDTVSQKLFKKVVDHEVIVSGNNNLRLKIGNGATPTKLSYMIISSKPESPKYNETLLQNTPSEYGFTCGKCHVQDITQAKHTSHVNSPLVRGTRDAEIAFDANSFPKNPLGGYTQVGFATLSAYIDGQGFRYTGGRSCVNTYCHGSTLWGAGGSGTNPQWKDGYVDVDGASLCGACHDSGYGLADTTPNSNITTASHNKHLNSRFAYRYDCYKCHNRTVNMKNVSGVVSIKDKTYHVNGDVNAVFDPNDNTMKFGRYSTSLKTCYNVYCHSNGLLDQSHQPFWATHYQEPVWSGEPKTCNYCHGDGRADGMPPYANMTSTPNSHYKHVVDNKQGCEKCHYDTTRAGLTVLTSIQPSKHVDGEPDIVFDPENPSGTYNHGNLECANTYCHGLSAPPTWGGIVTCGSCHGISQTNPSPGDVGKHVKHTQGNYGNISTTDANNSTVTDYDFDCRFCHFITNHGTGEHIPGTQNAEANFNAINVTNGYNNSGATYITGGSVYTDANNWHYTNGRCRSTKCHSNGMGGLPNITTFTWMSPANYLNCSGCHGGPEASPYKLSTGKHSKHVWSSVYRFTCEDCHSLTSSNSGSIKDKAKHVNAKVEVEMDPILWGGTYNTANTTCSNVRCHYNGDPTEWKGSLYYVQVSWDGAGTTCVTCHANNYYPAGDGVRTAPQTLSYSHYKHMSSSTGKRYAARIGCKNCHYAVAASNTSLTPKGAEQHPHNNGAEDIAYFTTFFNHTGSANGGEGIWGAWNSPGIGDCTTICHSNGLGGSPARFPNWSSAVDGYGCKACHGDKNTLTTGSHAKHLGGNIGCSVCHRLTAGGDAVSPFINASGYTVHHVDGNTSNDIKLGLSFGGTYNTSTKVCSNTSCHGNPGSSPVWGSSNATLCRSCHSGPPKYAQHFAHFSSATLANTTTTSFSPRNRSTATVYRFGCGKCHVSYGSDPVHHAQGYARQPNQAAEVKFDGYSAPANALGKYTTAGALMGTDEKGFKYSQGTCLNTYCHSNGRGTPVTVNWNSGAMTCTSCHGGPATYASVSMSPSHKVHVGTDRYAFTCNKCHVRTVQTGNSPVNNKAKHVNEVKDVFINTTTNPSGSWATPTCSGLYCHSSGQSTASTGSATWGSSYGCTSCHGYTVASGTAIATVSHPAHINNGNLAKFRCVDCHDATVLANNTGIMYSSKHHVDKVKDVSVKAFNNLTGGYSLGAKTCRNTYCHSSGQKASGTLPNISTPVARVTPVWGAGSADCKSCHGVGGANGEPNYVNRSSASTAWFNGHAKHVKSAADCTKCHNQTVDGAQAMVVNSKHLNGGRDVNFRTDIGGSYNTTSKRCSGTSCHPGAALRWGGSLPNDCQSCHSDQGAGTYGNHTTNGKHSKHVNRTTYRFACEVCHATMNASGNSEHATGVVSADRAAQVAFHNASANWKTVKYGKDAATLYRYKEMDSALGASHSPTYNAWTTGTLRTDSINSNLKWTQGRCTNIWCHSNGQNPTGYVSFPNWSTAETVKADCTSCHGGTRTSSSVIASNKHGVHVNNGDAELGSFRCAICHVRTVATNTTIDNYPYHVNGVRNVNITSFTVNNYTGAYTASSTCRNTYCHSSGQSTPNHRTTAAWNSATNYDCKACHGADGGFTSQYGEPNYANQSTATRNAFNSHQKHVKAAADCYKCHNATVDNTGQNIASATLHINGARNVGFSAGGAYNTTTKRCSGTSAADCHGSNTVRWGDENLTCADCHQVNSGETDNFTYGNGTRATVSFFEFTSVGHGRKGTYRYGTTAGANKGCLDCHVKTSPHDSAYNPFRLYSSGSVKPSQPDTLCMQGTCHSAPKNHDYANVGGSVTTWYFTPKCVDCHDPHGDSGGNDTTQRNYKMIQSFVNYSGASSAQGVPNFRRAMDFPAENPRPASKARTSYATATYDGICQICHKRGTGGVSNTANAAYFNRVTNDTTHYSGQVCSDCHGHSGGFAGAGGDCKQCHGTGGSAVTAGRRNIETEYGKRSHHVKANWTQIGSRHCARCHGEANPDGAVNSSMHNTSKAVWLKVWTGAFTQSTGIAAVGKTFVTYSTGTGSLAATSYSPVKLNGFCLGCHNTLNSATRPFNVMGVADTGTPSAYDTASGGSGAGPVSRRYSNTSTTVYSKYNPSTYNVVPQITKSFSPHGNRAGNQRDKVIASAWSNDAGNAINVGCFHCHNSHGSNAGVGNALKMLSYSSAVGGWYGGVIKQTSAYTPTQGGSSPAYSASADLCFDCHWYGGDGPYSFNTTFGMSSSVTHYYDAGRWQTTESWRGSFPFKYGGSGNGSGILKGGHFGASSALTADAARKAIGGRCTMCHDPHGITPGGSASYRLPALKGTWLTSPYKEDAAPTVSATTTQNTYESRFTAAVGMKPSRLNPRFDWNNPPKVGAGYGTGTGSGWGTGGSGAYGYYIDDNTFGTNITYGNAGSVVDGTTAVRYTNVTARRMTQNATLFAGLCTSCHTASVLQGITYSNGTTTNIHVHNTVKGWYTSGNASDLFRNWAGNIHEVASYTGAPGSDIRCTNYTSDTNENMPAGYRWSVKTGTYRVDSPMQYTRQPPTPVANTQSTRGYIQPAYHQFPCSKCHAPHTSKLPRLMKTNCMDVGTARTGPKHNTAYTYPSCDNSSAVGTGKWFMMECHNLKQENTPNGGGWNTKTGW